MLRSVSILMLLLGVSLLSISATAREINPPLSMERQGIIEKNIVAGLEHKSFEVQCDYIQLIIDLKRAYPKYDFDYTIIPLMDKLKNETNPSIRIIAALALYEFKDSRMSKFAIQQTALLDKTERVARHCKTLIRKWDDRSERPMFVAQVVYPF